MSDLVILGMSGVTTSGAIWACTEGNIDWVLPPLSNSWIMNIIWLYKALNRNPNMNCYRGGGVPKI